MEDNNKLDTGWEFPPRFFNKGSRLGMVSEEVEIRQALKLLLATSPGERLGYPDFGCDLNQFMFEPMNRSLAVNIRKAVTDAVIKYEPRIQLKQVDITEVEGKPHELHIRIEYFITSLNKLDSIVHSISVF